MIMRNKGILLKLTDLLCAALFSVGAEMVVLPALGLALSPGLLAPAVFILLCLFALCERRPWAPLAAAAGCGVLVYSVAALTGNLETLAGAVLQYAQKAAAEAFHGQPRFAVLFAGSIPVSLLFWMIMRWRRLSSLSLLWICTLLAVGLIGWKAAVQPEGWQAPFILLTAGVILILPRSGLRGEERLQAQWLAAALAVPVLGLTFLLGPKTDGEWQSAGVKYLVQDAQDFWEYHWGNLPAIPLPSMRSMGLQPQKDRLGGDVELGEKVILTSGKNMLLRGQALDLYTGSGWQDDKSENNGNFRLDSLFWQGRRQKAFGLDIPSKEYRHLLDDLLVEVKTELHSMWRTRMLLLPYRTRKVEPVQGSDLYFDMQGEVYWDRQPDWTIVYSIEAEAWDFRAPDFDRNMLALEKALASSEHDPLYDQAAEYCLQLPETLPGWVGELAAEVTQNSDSPYARAVALRNYLSETCEYTLTPGPTDPDADFVAAFLTGKKGYCTYYASALTVLCRCAGVPARYVTGYGMAPDGERFQATQATAHAWTEIYLENIGWVPLDALDQDIFLQGEPLPEGTQAGGNHLGPTATPSPSPAPGAGETVGAGPEKEPFDPTTLLWLALLPMAAMAVLIAKGLRSRRYTEKYVNRKYARTEPAAEHCYAGTLRLLRLLKLRPEPGETLLAFWQRAEERLPQIEGTNWLEIGQIMDRLRFGADAPSKEEVSKMCKAYHKLEGYIRKSQGLLGWLRV